MLSPRFSRSDVLRAGGVRGNIPDMRLGGGLDAWLNGGVCFLAGDGEVDEAS